MIELDEFDKQLLQLLQRNNRSTARRLEKFKSSMRQCPEVMQCYYVTGTYDFVAIVNVRDMRQYDEFVERRLMDNPNVKHFYTHVVMDRVKVGYSLPV